METQKPNNKHSIFPFSYKIFSFLEAGLVCYQYHLSLQAALVIVVLSMALTTLLNDVGRRASEFIKDNLDAENVCYY